MGILKEARKNDLRISEIPPQVHCTVFEDNSGALELARLPKMRPRTNILINPFTTSASTSSAKILSYKPHLRTRKWRISLRSLCQQRPSSSIGKRLWDGKAHAADGRECSIYDKIKFVRAMACAPSFTCAPHEFIRALQPRLRETFSKCPLQTLHYYDISTNKFGPKQTSIYSLTQRLLQGDIGCHDRMDIPDRAQ